MPSVSRTPLIARCDHGRIADGLLLVTDPTRRGEGPPVDECPDCDTKGKYDSRMTLGGRGIFTCPNCGTQWQNADEKPTNKDAPIIQGVLSNTSETRR